VHDKELFKGTLFERGGLNSYIGFEEFWFDNLDDLANFKIVAAAEAGITNRDDCFSVVTTERIVYDYSLGDKSSPTAAVLSPGTLEAQIYAQGLSGWNIPECLKPKV
jgi:hypothetical protein